MKGLIKDLYIRDNCHPFKASVVMVVQIPMWICLSFALRNMSGFVPYSAEGELGIGLLDFRSYSVHFTALVICETGFACTQILIDVCYKLQKCIGFTRFLWIRWAHWFSRFEGYLSVKILESLTDAIAVSPSPGYGGFLSGHE